MGISMPQLLIIIAIVVLLFSYLSVRELAITIEPSGLMMPLRTSTLSPCQGQKGYKTEPSKRGSLSLNKSVGLS